MAIGLFASLNSRDAGDSIGVLLKIKDIPSFIFRRKTATCQFMSEMRALCQPHSWSSAFY
jgi:hypothetical protein